MGWLRINCEWLRDCRVVFVWLTFRSEDYRVVFVLPAFRSVDNRVVFVWLEFRSEDYRVVFVGLAFRSGVYHVVFVWFAFSFIPHRSCHMLTVFISRFRDSVTAALSPGDGTINSYQSRVASITIKLLRQYGEKLHGVQEGQLRTQNTSLSHSWHHVNQFAMTTFHHDLLWPIRKGLCQNMQTAQNLQLRQSRA